MVVFRDIFNLSETDTSYQTSYNPYIHQILAPLHPVEMYVINLGANDGKSLDPVYSLFSCGARGLAVELNKDLLNVLNTNLPWDRVRKLSQRVSPLSIVDMLLMAGSPRAPDVFKIDIDSYDISVVDALLQNGTLTPTLILIEINEKIPPPIQFAITSHSDGKVIIALESPLRRSHVSLRSMNISLWLWTGIIYTVSRARP
jgi:hypothetical protein